jgi:hypothetical protein
MTNSFCIYACVIKSNTEEFTNLGCEAVKLTGSLITKEPFYCSHVALNCKVIN